MRSLRAVLAAVPGLLSLLLLSACPPPSVCTSNADCLGEAVCAIPPGESEGICQDTIFDAGKVDPDGGPTDGGDEDGGGDPTDAGDGGQDAPAILSFAPVAEHVPYGEAPHLSWSTEHVDECTLSYGASSATVAASATDYEVTGLSLTEDTTFTLSCTGAGGTVDANTTARMKVTLSSFTLSASEANEGAPVTASWTTHGADSCTLTGVAVAELTSGELSTGSRDFDATEDVTLTLECTGAGGTDSAEATLNVWRITSFVATPSGVGGTGQDVQLDWTTEDATAAECVVLGENEGNPQAPPLNVGTVSQETTFTLSCPGANGQDLTRDVVVPVLVTDILVSPEVVDYDSTATLTFSASSGVTCSIDDVVVASPHTLSGLVASQQIELVCDDAEGRASTTPFGVSVRPQIDSFTATLAKPASTVEVVLSWSVTANASSCDVLADGSEVVTAQDLTGTSHSLTTGTGKVAYSLRCESDIGAEVTAPGPTVWWDDVVQANVDGDAVAPATLVVGNVNLVLSTVSSLQNLDTVTEVGGSFLLDSDSITTLQGLGALRRVLGELTISGNAGLESASMAALTEVGGALTISSNSQLGSVSMGALTDVGGDFTVSQTGLQGFIGFSGLTRVAGAQYSVTLNASLPCAQVEERYCALTQRPSTYVNVGNSGTCDATTPTCTP